MDRPTIVEHLAHCGRHARRFKNLSWEDTATLSSYMSSLEHQLATTRAEALREAAEKIDNELKDWTAKNLDTWREYDAGFTTGLKIAMAYILQEPPQ